MNTDLFFFDEPDRQAPDTFWIDVPMGISSKDELMSTLERVAHFPDYFGRNWDALNDCLNDFHWVKQSRITLVHRDLPLLAQPEECMNYLDILEFSAEIYPGIEYVKPQFGTGLQVYFPASQQSTIHKLRPPEDV